MLLDKRAESAQLLQDRCQQIGQLLQEAAAASDYAAGCVTLHRKVGACKQNICYSDFLMTHVLVVQILAWVAALI